MNSNISTQSVCEPNETYFECILTHEQAKQGLLKLNRVNTKVTQLWIDGDINTKAYDEAQLHLYFASRLLVYWL